jgi:hypothetical protein
MSRVVLLALSEADVLAHCAKAEVGVSTIERLLGGGVRLVCSSSRGAATIRQKLHRHLIEGVVTRERHRPAKPLW